MQLIPRNVHARRAGEWMRGAPGHAGQWLLRAWQWVVRYEQPSDRPAPTRYRVWLIAATGLAIAGYTVLFTMYSVSLHASLQTHAEDLGIMDQVLWNTSHGHFMLQSICNPLSDVNCLGSVSRFAIHFEPILIPLSAIYLIAPNVNVLLFLQAAAVASGAIPAFLIAWRRLGHEVWGLVFALFYLIYLHCKVR